MSVTATPTVNLFEAYDNIAKTGRARKAPEVELMNPMKLRENDASEREGIKHLFRSGLKQVHKSLSKGDLEKLDAVTGDHNCHVNAAIVLGAFQDQKLQAEPLDSKDVPEEMRYLCYAAILRAGATFSLNRNCELTLKLEPEKIRRLSKNQCHPSMMNPLIGEMRKSLNLSNVHYVQNAAQEVLEKEEAKILSYVPVATNKRGDTLRYPCAFYSVKATLEKLAKEGTIFAIVQYNKDKTASHPPLLFDPKTSKRVEANPDTPVFVIQCYFNDQLSMEKVGEEIEKYGLMKLMLASIAVHPQFTDMEKEEYSHDEDIKDLTEVQAYRSEGKRLGIDTENPAILRVAHTYADTYKNLCKGVKK